MRRNVSGSRLVSLLGNWAAVDTKASRQDWAAELSLWLGPFDAMTLHAAHQAMKAAASEKLPPSRKASSGNLEAEFRRVRSVLVSGMRAQGEAADTDFASYRQRYLAQQRRMELAVETLRDHVRQVLSQTSVRLRQLAALDAALEKTLGVREKVLLSKLPALLGRRFEHLKKTVGDGLDGAQPQRWLDVFGQDVEDLLLAELNFRLEPVAGLVEAFSNET